MCDDDLQSGEFRVRNKYGDVVQSGELITVETPGGVESITTQPVTLRQGDSFTSVTKIELE